MNQLFSLALVALVLATSTGCVGQAAVLNVETNQIDAAVSDDPQTAAPPPSAPAEPEEPFVRVIEPSKPMVAITFDDGPHESFSNQILDILEENHAVATFFEVGCNVAKYPDILTREAQLGCEIGSHSNAHRNLSKLTEADLLQDLADADEAFTAAGVPAPTLVRPPYGAVNKFVKYSTGRSMITWNVDTEDWKTKDAQTVVSYLQGLDSLDGDVVLMHSTHESTVEAAKILIPWLQEQGYQLVTVTELMAYYYGELPQPNVLYGYTYFTGRSRTDTPLQLPVPTPAEAAPDVA